MTEAGLSGTTIALLQDEVYMKTVLFTRSLMATALLVCTFVVTPWEAGAPAVPQTRTSSCRGVSFAARATVLDTC